MAQAGRNLFRAFMWFSQVLKLSQKADIGKALLKLFNTSKYQKIREGIIILTHRMGKVRSMTP